MMSMAVCLRVCLYASISPKLHIQSSPFLRMLPKSLTQSSSGGVAIRCASWMSSYFQILARNRRNKKSVYSK